MINLNRFDLVTLRLFVAVLDAGSLTAGAQRFGISLAAASKRIAELEQHCGVALLQRGQRGVSATREGQTVHRLAVDVVARLEQLAQSVDDFRAGATEHLRLCANPSAFGGFLPGVLARYVQQHPHVRIELEDLLSEDAIRAVHKGQFEVAVIGDNVPFDDLETIPCHADELVLLAHKQHALAGQQVVHISQALAHDQVALARSASLTRKVIAAAETAGLTLRIRVQVRSFDAMCRMVACGLGLAVLPRMAAELYVQALGLVMIRLEGAEVQRRLLLALRQRATLSPAAQAFVAMVEADGLRELGREVGHEGGHEVGETPDGSADGDSA